MQFEELRPTYRVAEVHYKSQVSYILVKFYVIFCNK